MRLHESINKHRRLPVSTTSAGIFPSPLDISAAKVKRESPAEREAFNPWKQRIVVVVVAGSLPQPPPGHTSTLRHSIFHYFPIVRASLPSRPFPSVSSDVYTFVNGPEGSVGTS